MQSKVRQRLQELVTRETKEEKWAVSAALLLLQHDLRRSGELIQIEFYVQYGISFADAVARALLTEDDISTIELSEQDKKKIIKLRKGKKP